MRLISDIVDMLFSYKNHDFAFDTIVSWCSIRTSNVKPLDAARMERRD